MIELILMLIACIGCFSALILGACLILAIAIKLNGCDLSIIEILRRM